MLLFIKIQYFPNNCVKLATNNPKYGTIALFGHLYNTINSSIASVYTCMSDMTLDFSTYVNILNEEFINKVKSTYNELKVDSKNCNYKYIYIF